MNQPGVAASNPPAAIQRNPNAEAKASEAHQLPCQPSMIQHGPLTDY